MEIYLFIFYKVHLSKEFGCHVVLAPLDVDVGQEKPAPLQVIGVFKVPAVLRHSLQLISEVN
jgi:hypothetical protein